MILKLVVLALVVTLIGCAGRAGLSAAPAVPGNDAEPALQAGVLPFPAAAADDEERLAKAMPELARQSIVAYAESDRQRYLDNLLRFQLVSGDPAGALATLDSLRDLPSAPTASADPGLIVLNIYAIAKSRATADGHDFGKAYGEAFRQVYAGLDDREALDITYWLETPAFVYERNLYNALSRLGPSDGIGQADAAKLVRAYLADKMYAETQPYLPALIGAEEQRRYEITDDVLIHTPDGATLSAVAVRPRSAREPLPAVLVFSIDTDLAGSRQLAKTAAAHGYVGLVADTRGKRLSPDAIEPYEHEVDDTYAVIDWVSRQPWSNGEVGMYGGSYSGYAAWAATKRLHPALKTIVPYVAAIPGQGLPMTNNVFLNANYGWGFFVSNNKFLDSATYNDPDRWDALNRNWYASGRPYREIDQVDGTPNPLLQRWLEHPAYDAYWQAKVPYQQDFARINIPVLSITGYYDDGQISALRYLREHYKYNKDAEHYLVIGPYDHGGAQARRKPRELRGYTLDPVALFDTQELTFQWLDYVLRDGDRPALLKGRINYEVMGANVWHHAPSLEAMSNETLKLYLTTDPAGENHRRLAEKQPGNPAALKQVVDLADRTISHNDYYPSSITGKDVQFTGLSFISEPLEEPVAVNGMFSGNLKVTINKRDFDFGVVLYELMPDGTLLHLSYYLGRASFAEDISIRRLLTPDRVESISFERSMLVSRQLQQGSRLLVVLDVNKNPYHQINYGTGRDVSDESITDAGEPLKVSWHNDSYVEIPIWR
ncbi:MAG: CocE/NonD family hydrolase [Pseudomonadota bacterium]|nr:CocE/NonD family hydrolase [Pseudomonadota bacterium]